MSRGVEQLAYWKDTIIANVEETVGCRHLLLGLNFF
jgi:hypothetical protein